MAGQSRDPTAVSVIVVRAEDVVTALETNLTSDEHAVVRLTPPFSGRMRARLHVERGAPEEQPTSAERPQPVRIDPAALLDDPPPYPRPAETEEQIRTDPDRTYSVATHHECHTQRVADWRQTIATCIRDRAPIEAPTGRHEVTVSVLGEP
jgi:hypothetical protein